MPTPPALAQLSSTTLTQRLAALVAQDRASLVEFLWHLAELDRRREVVQHYPSLFEYCCRELRLSKSSAGRRIAAARALVACPIAADYLEDGRITLSTFLIIKDALAENPAAVLDRASGLTEEEAAYLLAELKPRPVPSGSIRRLPEKSPVLPLVLDTPDRPDKSSSALPQEKTPPPRVTVAATVSRAGRLEPIAPGIVGVHLYVSDEFIADLKKLTSALSHRFASGKPEVILHEAIKRTLKQVERSRYATLANNYEPSTAKSAATTNTAGSTPGPGVTSSSTIARSTPGPGVTSTSSNEDPATLQSSDSGRYIPSPVRREVFFRDDGRCTHRDEAGKRCGSTHQLEFHHLIPHARGGPPTAENLTLHCKAHNELAARHDFGHRHMDQFRRRSLGPNSALQTGG